MSASTLIENELTTVTLPQFEKALQNDNDCTGVFVKHFSNTPPWMRRLMVTKGNWEGPHLLSFIENNVDDVFAKSVLRHLPDQQLSKVFGEVAQNADTMPTAVFIAKIASTNLTLVPVPRLARVVEIAKDVPDGDFVIRAALVDSVVFSNQANNVATDWLYVVARHAPLSLPASLRFLVHVVSGNLDDFKSVLTSTVPLRRSVQHTLLHHGTVPMIRAFVASVGEKVKLGNFSGNGIESLSTAIIVESQGLEYANMAKAIQERIAQADFKPRTASMKWVRPICVTTSGEGYVAPILYPGMKCQLCRQCEHFGTCEPGKYVYLIVRKNGKYALKTRDFESSLEFGRKHRALTQEGDDVVSSGELHIFENEDGQRVAKYNFFSGTYMKRVQDSNASIANDPKWTLFFWRLFVESVFRDTMGISGVPDEAKDNVVLRFSNQTIFHFPHDDTAATHRKYLEKICDKSYEDHEVLTKDVYVYSNSYDCEADSARYKNNKSAWENNKNNIYRRPLCEVFSSKLKEGKVDDAKAKDKADAKAKDKADSKVDDAKAKDKADSKVDDAKAKDKADSKVDDAKTKAKTKGQQTITDLEKIVGAMPAVPGFDGYHVNNKKVTINGAEYKTVVRNRSSYFVDDGSKLLEIPMGSSTKKLNVSVLVAADLKKAGVPVLEILKQEPTLLERPKFDLNQRGHKIGKKAGLTSTQKKDLEGLFDKVVAYVKSTGVPINLRDNVLLWDDGHWKLLDTYPRWDQEDSQPYGYTSDRTSFENYFAYWSKSRSQLPSGSTIAETKISIG